MLDLFGEATKQPQEKTFEQKYQDYISSPKWKRLRDAKIESVGGVCERCGISKWSVTLEVHHLHYKTFKQEGFSDLEVLCHDCHVFADTERQTLADLEKKANQEKSSLYIGFIRWMEKGNEYIGQINSSKAYDAKTKFLTMLYNKQGKAYSLDLRFFGYHDDEPSWKPGDKR